MTASDRTLEFREVLKGAQNTIPEAKRRKVTKRAGEGQREGQDTLSKEYLAEAYNVVCPHFFLPLLCALTEPPGAVEPHKHSHSDVVLHS